jgi:membrane-associated phospholipid phosphatase
MANLSDSKALRPLTAASTPGHAPRYHAWLGGSIIVISAICFAVLAFTAHSVTLFSFDMPVTQALQHFNPPWFDLPMQAVNWMGFGLQAVALVSAVVLTMFLVGWRWEAVVCAVDAAGIWILNILVGIVVNRPHATPAELAQLLVHDFTEPSFPSGHVTSYIGIYGFVCYLVYKRVKQPWLRIPLLIFFGAVVVLIGPSRPYMGRHWPSDVLASLFLGTIWLILTLYVYQWGKGRFFAHRA